MGESNNLSGSAIFCFIFGISGIVGCVTANHNLNALSVKYSEREQVIRTKDQEIENYKARIYDDFYNQSQADHGGGDPGPIVVGHLSEMENIIDKLIGDEVLKDIAITDELGWIKRGSKRNDVETYYGPGDRSGDTNNYKFLSEASPDMEYAYYGKPQVLLIYNDKDEIDSIFYNFEWSMVIGGQFKKPSGALVDAILGSGVKSDIIDEFGDPNLEEDIKRLVVFDNMYAKGKAYYWKRAHRLLILDGAFILADHKMAPSKFKLYSRVDF